MLGHLVCRLIRPVASPVRHAAPALANLTIVWIIAVVVALNRGRLLGVFGGEISDAGPMLLTLLALNVFGYAAGYAGGGAMRLDGAMRRALTLEVGMQNAGLGTVLVLNLFKDDAAAAIPTALYTFGCMLTGTILAQWWSRAGG